MKTMDVVDAIDVVHQAVVSNEAAIESLDRAIGDGDHYLNVLRGCEVLTALRGELAPLAPGEALGKIGMKLLSTIGGASGPLISSFFMATGKRLGNLPEPPRAEFAQAFADGVGAIKSRGKADLGQKTMLDVLIPVAALLTARAGGGGPLDVLCDDVSATAQRAMESTRDMVATKGRAAFLGERARGHIDPGSKSSAVVIAAVCEMLKERA